MKSFLICLAVAVGLFRPVLLLVDFNPHLESSYQAVSHILIGILLGLWLATRKTGQKEPWLMRTFWSLNSIEIVCAIITAYLKNL